MVAVGKFVGLGDCGQNVGNPVGLVRIAGLAGQAQTIRVRRDAGVRPVQHARGLEPVQFLELLLERLLSSRPAVAAELFILVDDARQLLYSGLFGRLGLLGQLPGVDELALVDHPARPGDDIHLGGRAATCSREPS